MNQIKIGEFISIKRKEKKLTQQQLANQLNISDRAISKWENGICFPDANNIQNLCSILGISINDLFCGEIVDEEDKIKKLEENLLEMIKLKEQRDRELLSIEIFIGIISSIILFTCTFISSFSDIDAWLKVTLFIMGIVPFIIGICIAIRIEQIAGYYECHNCHFKYVPTYKRVFFSMHLNRTRKMQCPQCGVTTWHKKVIERGQLK